METNKQGAVYALALGLPAGLVCCLLLLPLMDYFPFSLLLKVSSFRVFWHPAAWLSIALTLCASLWYSGMQISRSLQRHYVLRTSFLFTLNVNIRLLIGLCTIYIGGTGLRMVTGYKPLLAAVPYGILALAGILAIATLFFSISVSLAIVLLTKNKLNANHGV